MAASIVFLLMLILGLGACVQQPIDNGMSVQANAERAFQSAKIHTELAAEYFHRGQLDVALEEVTEALKAQSDYALAYNVLGLINMTLNENSKALDNFEQAIRKAPKNPEIHNNYGWFLCQRFPQRMDQAISVLEALFGKTPIGWYTGRDSPNTRQLLAEFPQIQYDCDHYGDDLPFWSSLTDSQGNRRAHLIIPYTLECNDMKFSSAGGFNTGEQFYQYLKDSFDVLYAEGEFAPKMMSIGMHCRLLGRPGRLKALQRFLDYVQSHEKVWICKRGDIASHWQKTHGMSEV